MMLEMLNKIAPTSNAVIEDEDTWMLPVSATKSIIVSLLSDGWTYRVVSWDGAEEVDVVDMTPDDMMRDVVKDMIDKLK